MLTGEPLPVAKEPGDKLTGGTVNGNGALVMVATHVGADTVLSRIIAMVERRRARNCRCRRWWTGSHSGSCRW